MGILIRGLGSELDFEHLYTKGEKREGVERQNSTKSTPVTPFGAVRSRGF